MVYLVVLDVVLISLIIRTDTSHRNSEIYQAMQIGVLQCIIQITFTSQTFHIGQTCPQWSPDPMCPDHTKTPQDFCLIKNISNVPNSYRGSSRLSLKKQCAKGLLGFTWSYHDHIINIAYTWHIHDIGESSGSSKVHQASTRIMQNAIYLCSTYIL